MSLAERASIHPSRIRLCLAAFGLVVCLALTAAPGAAAVPDWRPSLRVEDSPSGAALSFPKIAARPGGCATVAFERGGTLFASTRPAGGLFAPTQTLAAIAPGDYPDLATGGGLGAVAWDGGASVRVAVAGGCEPFPAPGTVPDTNATADDPAIAVDGSGRGVLAFGAGGSGSRKIYVSEVPPGDSPSSPVPLEPPAGTEAFRARVAANGSAAGVAFDVVSSGLQVYGSRRTGPGAWTAPVQLNQAGKPASSLGPNQPQVAVGADGSLHAVWIDAANKEVILGTLSPAGVVSRSTLIIAGGLVREPDIAADAAGRLAIVWAEQVTGGQARIYGKHREPGGALSPQRSVSSATSKFRGNPAVTIDRYGRTVATWSELVSMGIQETAASTRVPPSDFYLGQETISDPTQYTSPSGISTDADGNTLVALYVTDSPREARVAAFDAAPPLVGGLSIPAAGVTGETLPFSLTALDAWSPPASAQWSFGDGAGAPGLALSHAYTAPGSFPVQATVADALGNSTTAEGATTIAPPPLPPAPPQGLGPGRGPGLSPAPTLGPLELAPKRLAVGSKRCIRIRFTLSEPAEVLWTAERRKRRGWGRVPGSMRRKGEAGQNRFCFRGRLGKRKLVPGSYRLRAVATDADGKRSQPRTAAFTLARR